LVRYSSQGTFVPFADNQLPPAAGDALPVIPSATHAIITASRFLMADGISIREDTKSETSAPARLYIRMPSVIGSK